MNTIQQAVTIPADRRLQVDLLLPDSFPAGEAEMLLVLSPPQMRLQASRCAISQGASLTAPRLRLTP